MNSLSANEAKTRFGEMLLQAQREPVQINKNGKAVAVVVSMEEYAEIEALKLRQLQRRAEQAMVDIKAGNVIDGELFFADMDAGKFD